MSKMRISLQYDIQHHHNRWNIIVLIACLTGTNCDLLLKPENSYAKYGDPNTVILMCESTLGYRLSWLIKTPWSSEKVQIFDGYRLSKNVTSYCRVINGVPGKYNVSLTSTTNAAQQYVCLEPGTMMEASAEIIIIESDPECSNVTTDGENTTLTCSIRFHGNWAPVMEWTMGNKSGVISEGVNNTRDGNSLTSRLVVPAKKSHAHKLLYACTTKFRLQEKPLDTTADNIPPYNYTWKYLTEPYNDADNDAKEETEAMVMKEGCSKPAAAAVIAVPVVAALLGAVVCMKRRKTISEKERINEKQQNAQNVVEKPLVTSDVI